MSKHETITRLAEEALGWKREAFNTWGAIGEALGRPPQPEFSTKVEAIRSLAATIDALRSEVATERAAREAAEAENARLREALEGLAHAEGYVCGPALAALDETAEAATVWLAKRDERVIRETVDWCNFVCSDWGMPGIDTAAGERFNDDAVVAAVLERLRARTDEGADG